MSTRPQNIDKAVKLSELVSKEDIMMLVTKDEQNHFNSRPMQTCFVSDHGELYFFFTVDMDLTDHITQCNNVNISTMKSSDQSYLSVSGVAQVISDADTIAKYWDESFSAWIPEGLADPELRLLKVTLLKGTHWGFTDKMERFKSLFSFGDSKGDLSEPQAVCA